jgi:hypothetical protein
MPDENDLEKIDHLMLTHAQTIGLMEWREAFTQDIMVMIITGKLGPLRSIPANDLLDVIEQRMEQGVVSEFLKEVSFSRPGFRKVYLVPLDTVIEVG